MTTLTFPTRQHELLASLAGAWEGPTRLWLDPTRPPEESRTTARFRVVANGCGLLQEYEGTACGEPHHGAVLLAFDDHRGKVMAAWTDSFHNSSGLMRSEGDATDEALVDVRGTYEGGGETWGWRTVFRLVASDTLEYLAFNIEPNGTEQRAIETRFHRAGA